VKPLDKDEVLKAIKTSWKVWSPGIHGVPHGFYKEYWDLIGENTAAVLNEILKQGELSGTQKQGIMILVPKTPHPSSTANFKPITLLTTGYKILTKTSANRLKPQLTKPLHASQHGCVPGRTILNAVSTVRDVIAYKNVTQDAGCTLPMDLSVHTTW
jgi:hypothetical protein